MIKEFLKFAAVTALGILLLLAVRCYAFTIFTVPDTIFVPAFYAGDRVMVNRLSHAEIRKGDWVVVEHSHLLLGRILSVPGDTVAIRSHLYRIPTHCCKRCVCDCCNLYRMDIGKDTIFVRKSEILGRATRLFNFKLWK